MQALSHLPGAKISPQFFLKAVAMLLWITPPCPAQGWFIHRVRGALSPILSLLRFLPRSPTPESPLYQSSGYKEGISLGTLTTHTPPQFQGVAHGLSSKRKERGKQQELPQCSLVIRLLSSSVCGQKMCISLQVWGSFCHPGAVLWWDALGRGLGEIKKVKNQTNQTKSLNSIHMLWLAGSLFLWPEKKKKTISFGFFSVHTYCAVPHRGQPAV